jgi:hypothetical protein
MTISPGQQSRTTVLRHASSLHITICQEPVRRTIPSSLRIRLACTEMLRGEYHLPATLRPSTCIPTATICSTTYVRLDLQPMIDQPSQVGNAGYNELMPFAPKVPPARPIVVPRQRYARQNFSTSYQVAGTALTQQVSSHRCQAVYRRTTLGEPALGGGQDTWSNTGSGPDSMHHHPEHAARYNTASTHAAEAPTASYSADACQSVQDSRSVTHVCSICLPLYINVVIRVFFCSYILRNPHRLHSNRRAH